MAGAENIKLHIKNMWADLEKILEAATGGILWIKVWRPEALQLYSKQTPTQVFPVKFEKYLRMLILKNICEGLFLNFKQHVTWNSVPNKES